jgi:hypothetical protein
VIFLSGCSAALTVSLGWLLVRRAWPGSGQRLLGFVFCIGPVAWLCSLWGSGEAIWGHTHPLLQRSVDVLTQSLLVQAPQVNRTVPLHRSAPGWNVESPFAFTSH